MRRAPKNRTAEIDSGAPEQESISLSARILRCAEQLHHSACLAAIAAQGAEPEDGAQLLVGAIDDLHADLLALRNAAKDLTLS